MGHRTSDHSFINSWEVNSEGMLNEQGLPEQCPCSGGGRRMTLASDGFMLYFCELFGLGCTLERQDTL